MSTIAPSKAAQPALALLMVRLIVNGIPLRSLTMLVLTKADGVCVGNGPAVSLLVDPQSDAALLSCIVFDRNKAGAVTTMPKNPKPFLIKSFLSIAEGFKYFSNLPRLKRVKKYMR